MNTRKNVEEKTFTLFTAAVRQDNASGGESPAGGGD
jgi:hypothetical protein